MNSRGYQLSSKSTPGNKADAQNVHYTRYTVRRLTAEQLADALDFATGTRGEVSGPAARHAGDPACRTAGVKSFLLDTFGRPPRQITCECERTTQPNIAQALHLLNGEFLNKKIADAQGAARDAAQGEAGRPSDRRRSCTW